MKNLFLIFLCCFLTTNALAQKTKTKKANTELKNTPTNKKMDEFLKNFPELGVGSTAGVKECKTALDARVPREAIANMDYKAMLYESAKNTDKWDIMPIGKFKIKEGVYFVLYFSAYIGANHTKEYINYVLNTSIIDFNQSKQTGTNQGNNAEFIVMTDNQKQQLLKMLGQDSKFTVAADFEFKITAQNTATMTSNWAYTRGDNVQKTYSFSWDNEGNLSIK